MKPYIGIIILAVIALFYISCVIDAMFFWGMSAGLYLFVLPALVLYACFLLAQSSNKN